MDGGYSWVICAVTFISNFFVMMGVAVFAVIYEDFLRHFSATNAETAMIISLNNALGAFSGLLLGPIINRYGCRPVALVGSVLGAFGYGGCFFAQSIFHLCIGFGVLSGLANGMLLFSATVLLNRSFDRRRSLATAVASCGISAAPLIMPPVTRWFVNIYGWRTAMVAIGGLYLHNCIGASLMRPTTRDFRSPTTIAEESSKDSEIECCNSTLVNLILFFRSIWKSFDISMFRDPRVSIFLVGSSVNIFGYLVPVIFIPVYAATSFGISPSRAAILTSIISGAMIGGRITSGVLGDRIKGLRTARLRVCQYSIPSIVCGLSSMTTYLMESDAALTVYCCIFGFFTGSYIVAQQPVIVDLFGLDRLSNVFSFLLLFNGVTSFLSQPFAGWLVDVSGSFGLAFVAAGLIQVLSAFLLLVLVPLSPSARTKKQIVDQCDDMSIEVIANSDKLANHSNGINENDMYNNNNNKNNNNNNNVS